MTAAHLSNSRFPISSWRRLRTPRCAVSAAVIAVAGAAWFPVTAQAAQPTIAAAWTTEVSAASATFHGEINPEGTATTYRFEYLTDVAYQANPPAGRFNGAAKAPVSSSCPSSGCAGAGSGFVTVSQHVSALKSATIYHYRLSATSSEGTTTLEPALTFTTQGTGAAFSLPDNRGWEMVSPADKNGGAVQGFEENHGGGVLQAAASGPGAMTYTSASSFGGYEAQGAPPASQYISTRSSSGWSTQNITTPVISGSYGNDPSGVPYQLFSGDLARGLLLNGVHCRGEGTGCPVANPPLAGTEAPAGYQDYYLRDNGQNAFTALITAANSELAPLTSSQFDLAFAGASPDLRHLILSTCAALRPGATEVPGSEGCDPAEPNLYEWSGGALALVNVSPDAQLAAPAGAVSTDGSRVYFNEAGKLWLREGASAPHELAEGGEFQTATPNGAFAFYTKAGHLYRYDATTHAAATDLTPAGGVTGVLGASDSGAQIYFQDASGLERWSGSTATLAPGAAAAQASDYPPSTGTARLSTDGNRLLFLSKASLTGYDNHDATTGQPDSELFLYNAGSLSCLSCNPTGERPLGPSTIPGAIANGTAPGSTEAYKPRNLSATANRVFFDSSDALVALDTDRASDAYQWEAQGTGNCAKAGGCVALISSGTDGGGASFLDATESGEDAYFLTSSSLVGGDPGSRDVYDARVGGGFPVPTTPIPCEGDACQALPNAPEDPTVGTLIPGPGNPPVHFPAVPCKSGFVRKHGKCVKKPHHKHKHRKHTAHRSGR